MRKIHLENRLAFLGSLVLLAISVSPAFAADGMQISSSVFAANGPIPARYTCEGENVSPPLGWLGVPAGAKSLALIVDDPDAPDPAAPKMTFVHWVLFDIPPAVNQLPENAKALPTGAHQGANGQHEKAYHGPCPPIGRHRYFFKLYALDTSLGLTEGASKGDVEKAMQGHIVGQATVIGTYEKRK